MVRLRRKKFAHTNQNCIVFPRVQVTSFYNRVSIFSARVFSRKILHHAQRPWGMLDRASRCDRSPLFFNNNCSGIVDRYVIVGAIAWARSRVIAPDRPRARNHLRRNTNRERWLSFEWIGSVSIRFYFFL